MSATASKRSSPRMSTSTTEMPFAALVAIGAGFVVAGVMNPDLSDFALREREHPRQGLLPGLGILHVADRQEDGLVGSAG